MKNIYLTLLFSFLLSDYQAQHSFPMENAHWCYRVYGDNNQNFGNFCIEPKSGFVINGKNYAQIIYQKEMWSSITEYYRVDSNRVYVLPADSTREFLIYDFNLKVNDTFLVEYGWGIYEPHLLKVNFIDTLSNGRRRWQLSGPNGKFTTWIEGVGDEEWPFAYPSYTGSLSGGFYLICASVDSVNVYPNNEGSICGIVSTKDHEKSIGLKVTPNPVTNSINVALEKGFIKKASILDIHGRRVDTRSYFYSELIKFDQIEHIPNGIFILEIVTDADKVIHKMFVKH